jgi:hypothetical protein
VIFYHGQGLNDLKIAIAQNQRKWILHVRDEGSLGRHGECCIPGHRRSITVEFATKLQSNLDQRRFVHQALAPKYPGDRFQTELSKNSVKKWTGETERAALSLPNTCPGSVKN